jgi:hypothetical protein
MKLFFPEVLDNKVRFNKIILSVFYIIAIITVGRSLIHMFANDGGANSIATIIVFSGNPDPNQVIYFIFSLWGLSQLIIGFIYIISIIKYKSMIPLLYVLIWFEYLFRFILGKFLKPLSDTVLSGTAPGEIGNYIIIVLIPILLIWMIIDYKRSISIASKND